MDKKTTIQPQQLDILEILNLNKKEPILDKFGNIVEEEEKTRFSDIEDIKDMLADREILGKKVIVEGGQQKKIALVNDYRDFYYLNQGKKKGQQKLYHCVTKRELANRNFDSLRLDTLILTKHYKQINKSLEENMNFLKLSKNKDKSIILLNPTKGGYYAMYKGIIGFISAESAYKASLDSLSLNVANTVLPSQTSVKTKPLIRTTEMDIIFPTIKNNFSKGKKRRINFTELNIIFKEKDYENSGKGPEANNTPRRRV